jgi:hypothetical protein
MPTTIIDGFPLYRMLGAAGLNLGLTDSEE